MKRSEVKSPSPIPQPPALDSLWHAVKCGGGRTVTHCEEVSRRWWLVQWCSSSGGQCSGWGGSWDAVKERGVESGHRAGCGRRAVLAPRQPHSSKPSNTTPRRMFHEALLQRCGPGSEWPANRASDEQGGRGGTRLAREVAEQVC
jgi:hypothetical protein